MERTNSHKLFDCKFLEKKKFGNVDDKNVPFNFSGACYRKTFFALNKKVKRLETFKTKRPKQNNQTQFRVNFVKRSCNLTFISVLNERILFVKFCNELVYIMYGYEFWKYAYI